MFRFSNLMVSAVRSIQLTGSQQPERARCTLVGPQALRQFQFRVGAGNFCVVHVSLVPVLGVVGEQKTKPTQHSVAVLRSLGLNPTLLACRSTDPIEPAVREKLVSGHCCRATAQDQQPCSWDLHGHTQPFSVLAQFLRHHALPTSPLDANSKCRKQAAHPAAVPDSGSVNRCERM